MKTYRALMTFGILLCLTALFLFVVPVTHANPTGENLTPPQAHASPTSGLVSVCDEANLNTALAGGGVITFSCTGTITITAAKTIASNTTIDGGGNITFTAPSSVRIFNINSSVALTLVNLTIANMNNSSYPILNSGGTINLSNDLFINNAGSIIYNTCGFPCTARMSIINTQFISNSGYVVQSGNNPGWLTITNSSFINGTGEQLYNTAGWSGNLDNVQFINNKTGDSVRSSGPLSISNSIFQSNNSGNGSSPIWMTGAGAILTLTSSSFISNSSNYGGAIYNDQGKLYITNTTFTSNTATAYNGTIYENYPIYAQILSSTFQSNLGGAIYINGGGNPLVIADSNFISNTAACSTGAINSGTITVTNSNFIGNVGGGGACNPYSGAIDASNNAYISGSTFINNHGTKTGGLYLTSGTSTTYNDTILNSVIKGNVGQGQWGGGVGSTENLTIVDTEISGNILQSSIYGAGVYYWSPNYYFTMTRSLLYNNIVTGTNGVGGGLSVYSKAANIDNSTIYSNTASNGGGIYVNGGAITLTNNTLVSNIATTNSNNGGNIRNGSLTPVNVRNTIMANGTQNNCSGLVSSQGHNLSSDNSCGLNATGDVTNTNPLLDVFANNGGSTYSFMPLLSSPAVNKGDNATCPSVDQRGVPRPYGPACDIGAIESPYLTPQTISFTAISDHFVNDSSFMITATASSNLAVTFDSLGVCNVNNSNLMVTLTGIVGSCTITATQFGDANFAPAAPVTRTFNVTLVPQTITFNPLVTKVVTDTAFVITATASSNLPVAFASQTTSVCSVNTLTVTLLTGGTCTIRASQVGNTIYAPASNVDQSFTVQYTQTITFAALPNRLLAQSPFLVSASATSNGTVYFTASGQCNASGTNGTTITLTGLGNCTVTAHQDGNSNYAAAPTVAQTFSIITKLFLPLIVR